MRPLAAVFVILSALSAPGCTNPYDLEGRRPFECRDGVDNDGDGYFDCDDNGCWGSPDCPNGTGGDTGGWTPGTPDPDDDSDAPSAQNTDATGGGADTGDSGDTGDTGDTSVDPGDCAGDACGLASLRVVMVHAYDAPDGLCSELFPACDCVLTYEGAGEVVQTTTGRTTFDGSWRLLSVEPSDLALCEVYTGGVWAEESEEAYHSLHFNGAGALDAWVAHRSASGYDPIYSASAAMTAGQYPIWDMNLAWDGVQSPLVHTERVNWKMEGFVDMVTDVTATFHFDEAPAR